MAFDGAKSTKRIFRMVVRWIINIVIVLILVKAFSFSFDFMYNVFSSGAKNPSDTKVLTVTVKDDSSTSDVCAALEDAGVINNKYAFAVKLWLDKASIKPGVYEVSPSCGAKKLVSIITGNGDPDATATKSSK